MNQTFNGQVLQDKFVTYITNNKTNGFFLEIGANDPIKINNSYFLEKHLNWNGIAIEYNSRWAPLYTNKRPNTIFVISDATKIDYKDLLKKNNAPLFIDYLQIDLEVENRSTLTTLENIDKTIMDDYKFATITFEHDIYRGNFFDTRKLSREILDKRGYVLVFQDVRNGTNAFEDWYVHPELVDMNYVNKIKSNESFDYNEIMNILDNNKMT